MHLHTENRGDFPSFRISTFPDLEIPTSEKYRDFWHLGRVSGPEQHCSLKGSAISLLWREYRESILEILNRDFLDTARR
jgi:hypothetical protein